ncbi:glycosyltransferase family 4 protein [Cerasicoccus fimbriatus]|uniref:glycosyltransferase family 4 protein n=1 Tax=Cerasicoccus fimbriatus TaxID=3014554 RepID=UPI0022B3C0BC|nr:glycosyltransferase family 4 protein [Cerasicoccus sp. TK19100]
MRVAIVHYHLKPGGVTRVVENAFASMEGRGVQMAAFSGEPYTGDALIQTAVVPGLSYTQANEKPDPGALWFSLKKAAREALGGEPDVWHIHNHCLGKNMAMPQVVERLAAETPVLLQIHDFAEDGRPGNYAAISSQTPNMDKLYPQASQVHYGLLNSRDLSFLTQSNFATQSLHLLPNPIAVPELPPERATLSGFEGRRLLLYPTRAIRRKNLGELILWSAMAEEDQLFATTLTPANPAARPIYDRWLEFAGSLGLPVRFALGEHVSLSFPELMSAADAIISTSVAEGFGLAFLEPYLFHKPLVGRNLPDITSDFTNADVDLSSLYDRMMVPLDWVGEALIRETLDAALRDYYTAYNCVLPLAAVDEAFDAMTAGGKVEFGRLSEALQEKVILHVNANSASQSEIAPASLGLDSAGGCIASNRELIAQNFSLDRYGENLKTIYEKVAQSAVEPLKYASHQTVLDQFLDPQRFNLLRT